MLRSVPEHGVRATDFPQRTARDRRHLERQRALPLSHGLPVSHHLSQYARQRQRSAPLADVRRIRHGLDSPRTCPAAISSAEASPTATPAATGSGATVAPATDSAKTSTSGFACAGGLAISPPALAIGTCAPTLGGLGSANDTTDPCNSSMTLSFTLGRSAFLYQTLTIFLARFRGVSHMGRSVTTGQREACHRQLRSTCLTRKRSRPIPFEPRSSSREAEAIFCRTGIS